MPRFIRILTLASLAILALQVNADRAQVARHVHRGHDLVAKHKRNPSCNPRPSAPATLPPTSTPLPLPSAATSISPSLTSTAPPSTTSTPSSVTVNGSKKWGLAFNADSSILTNFELPKVGYVYNWGPTAPSPIPSGMVYVPMLWGSDQINEFQSTVVEGYAQFVLGMNEPNEPSQSNLSPQDAYNLWMQYINPLKDQGYTLVSAACTDDDAGLTWYQQFFSLCTQASGCVVDIISFHAYTTNAQDLINYATTLHNTYGLDVWITEFADQDYSGNNQQADMNQVWDFAGQVVSFVDNTPWLTMAAPFGIVSDLQGVNPDNALLGSDGSPTPLAYYYFD